MSDFKYKTCFVSYQIKMNSVTPIMHSLKQKVIIRIPFYLLVFWLICIPQFLSGQVEINLPSHLNITLNDSEFLPTETWNDSLIDEAQNGHIRYEIVTTYRNLSAVTTRIRIPQFYSLPEVMRQIVIYYYLLNNESERRNETLYIYPFFTNINSNPAIICDYKADGEFSLIMTEWPAVPVPPQPIPEHKFLYNQLIEADLSELASRDSIPDEIFKRVAEENNISVSRLREIYQLVKLWQLSQ